MPLADWLDGASTGPTRPACMTCWVQYDQASAGTTAKPRAMVAANAAPVVTAVRHCRVTARLARKNSGVSLMPAAMPLQVPRRREPAGRVRSHTTSSTRKTLICPNQMVDRTGSSAVTATARKVLSSHRRGTSRYPRLRNETAISATSAAKVADHHTRLVTVWDTSANGANTIAANGV